MEYLDTAGVRYLPGSPPRLETSATTVLSSALNREPTNDEARYNLAVAEFQTDQYSSVIETLNPLLQRDLPDPESLGLAAEACESLFDTPRAVDLLKKGIAAYPENPEFYVAFANLSLTHNSLWGRRVLSYRTPGSLQCSALPA